MESISSTKMTAGCMQPATAKSARTIFSPCPIHLLVSEDALMLKKVAWMLLAMALPIRVLPVPGGPNRSSPLAGALAPCKRHIDTLLMLTRDRSTIRMYWLAFQDHRRTNNRMDASCDTSKDNTLLQPVAMQRVLMNFEQAEAEMMPSRDGTKLTMTGKKAIKEEKHKRLQVYSLFTASAG